MDKEIEERFDRLDEAMETLSRMLSDIVSRLDSGRRNAAAINSNVAQQVALAKKMALSNPMIKGNKQAMRHVEEMFSTIPGGNEE